MPIIPSFLLDKYPFPALWGPRWEAKVLLVSSSILRGELCVVQSDRQRETSTRTNIYLYPCPTVQLCLHCYPDLMISVNKVYSMK